jgi:single-stranded DNA-specific DHH superfamily exonuclease
LHPLLVQVLLNREIDTPEAARMFLEPELQLLPSPLEEFPDLPIALELLLGAIATHQYIAICGDYDADGMTSTALLLRALRVMGAIVDYAIPSRMQEGYGINQRIIEEFHQEGVGIILTVDNGIAAYEPIARARELGLTVIVTDHHDIPETLPPANAILNPKLIREDSPYRGVAGVGVAYILAICLAQCLQKTQDLTTPLIELFTLGTIADLAPLTGVNRRWVKRGLKLLPKSRMAGVQALIQVAGLSQEKALKPEAIGFRLGPRINAIGRISDPQIVIELLTTDDDGRALELAMKCEQVNQLRQRLCELIEQEAIAWCEQSQYDWQQERVLVVVQPEWHHGVIGIVASRLVERYGVPVFIGTYEDEAEDEATDAITDAVTDAAAVEMTAEDGATGITAREGTGGSVPSGSATGRKIRGSARGIPEFNVFEALQYCADLLDKFGGHRAAGGFSFQEENLDAFRSRLRQFAHQHLQPDCLKPLVKIDVQAELPDLTFDLYQQIDHLHPCGIDNPDPVFWTPNVQVVEQQTIGRDQSHLKLTLTQGNQPLKSIKAIAWRWGDYYPLPRMIDIAYRLRLNEWNGTKSVEMELVGVRPASQPATAVAPLPAGPETSAIPAIPAIPAISAPPEEHNQRGGDSSASALPAAPEVSFEAGAMAAPTAIQDRFSLVSDRVTGRPLQTAIEFYYNARHYSCCLTLAQPLTELKIWNAEGQMLTVQPALGQGVLDDGQASAKAVELSDWYYFNLVQAALSALEIAEQDRMLCEKDQQIAKLIHQVTQLTDQLKQSSLPINQFISPTTSQPAQVLAPSLPMESLAPATLSQDEALNHQLQLQVNQPGASLKPDEIKQLIRMRLGDGVWSRLDQRSQKDLLAAYKQYYAIQADPAIATPPDYSDLSLRLCSVMEREVIQPFFKQTHQFLLSNGARNEIAGIPLRARKKYTLGMLPPLLAEQWQTFNDDALNSHDAPVTDDLYCTLTGSVSEDDRQSVEMVLQQWDHPLARWLRSHDDIASAIAQIDKLLSVAADAESCLYEWQFERLQALVMGSERQPGILREIYEDGDRPFNAP